MTQPKPIIFVSDVHLSPSRPSVTDLFLNFLQGPCSAASEVYILGDLFEGWIGDDNRDPFNQQIEQALVKLTKQGVRLFFMVGNRDFFIGPVFAARTGCTLLADPSEINVFGAPTLLMHGDTLCTADIGYQKFRKKIRQPWVRAVFLRLPLILRKLIFSGFRKSATRQMVQKPLDIMDVTQQTVMATFDQFNIKQMIHGHVHRSGIHIHTRPHGACKRLVLGDWGVHGSYIEATPDEDVRLKVFDKKI